MMSPIASFIDVHGHAYRTPYPGVDGKPVFSTPEQLIARYDELGVQKGALLPIVNPEVYLPQSNEEILDICEQYPDRFFPFCNIDPRAVNNDENAPLDYLLRHYKDKGCRGVGEVMPHLPFLHPLVQNLFKHTEAVGLPLTFDISARTSGDYGLYDDPGLPQLEECLRRFPKLQIIGHGPAFWAEISTLEKPEDRDGYPDYPIIEPGAVPRLMREYPNMLCDLSAGSAYTALARDPVHAVGFLNEFQDKIMFGLDICGYGDPCPMVPFLNDLKESGRITPEVFEKIANGNARRLLGV